MLLEQRQFLKGRQSFELLSEEIRISTRDSSGQQQFSVDLSTLSPKPARLASSATGPFGGMITFSVIYAGIIGGIFWGLSGDPDPVQESLIISGVIGTFMIPLIFTCFVKWRRTKYDVTTFFHRWNGNVVLNIANKLPDPAQAEKFIAELIQRIGKAAPIETTTDGIVCQLNQLNDLHRKEILNDEEFAAAKQRVLSSGSGERQIGF